MTLVLNGTNGLSDVDGSASTPAIRGTDANTGIFFPAADTIAFAEGGAEVARFDSSGNFGIGTSSPGNKLSVVSSDTTVATFRNPGAAISQSLVGNTAGDLSLRVLASGDSFIFSDTSKYLAFGTSATERARITSGGDLLVGTTSGTGARMDVVAADEVVSFNRSAATDGVVQRWRKAGSTVGYVSTNTYSLPSDERVKTNIVNIGYGLDFINSLRPVQYNTIFQDPENEAQKNFGLIAQEVEQALADIGKSVDDVTFLEKFVPENDRESRYGLGYQNLVPVLIKAIQEQQAHITTLTDRITALEAKP